MKPVAGPAVRAVIAVGAVAVKKYELPGRGSESSGMIPKFHGTFFDIEQFKRIKTASCVPVAACVAEMSGRERIEINVPGEGARLVDVIIRIGSNVSLG